MSEETGGPTTHEGARDVAAAYLRQRPGGYAEEDIEEVLTYEEAGTLHPRPDGYLPEPITECWVVRLRSPFPDMPGQQILLVSRRTGEVIYEGPAADEL